MTKNSARNLSSSFLKGPSGRLFTLLYTSSIKPTTRWVLHFPAFAEEMNKSRPMVSQMAREMSDNGYQVIVPDLYGTGDSEGDFDKATWQCWLDDMHFLVNLIQQQGAESIVFWGLRSGCLLAADLLKNLAEIQRNLVAQMIFWQPVMNGEQFVTQFLRLRVATSMMSGSKESVADLRHVLKEQGELEIAGYTLNDRLIGEMGQLSLTEIGLFNTTKLSWFDVAGSSEKPLPLVAQKLIDQWQQSGIAVDSKKVLGEPFWTTQEIAMAPALKKATIDAIGIVSKDELQFGSLPILESEADSGEEPVMFDCQGDRLIGIFHNTEVVAHKGVVLVVGGPQYRVGSHRQFVLLARALAEKGVPVLRFDYRGMGDSEGKFRGFEGLGQDIKCAVNQLMLLKLELESVVLLGLCDAATAAGFYAHNDSRISGLVLLNPWVRSEQGEAKAFIKHYYLKRVLSKNFWQKVAKGDFQVTKSLKSLVAKFRVVRADNTAVAIESMGTLAERTFFGLNAFKGKILLVLSGNDLTAAEFKDEMASSGHWGSLLRSGRFQKFELVDSDHTFSRREWKDMVAIETIKWIKSW